MDDLHLHLVYRVTFENGVSQNLTLIPQVIYDRYAEAKKAYDDKSTFSKLPRELADFHLAVLKDFGWVGQKHKKGGICTTASPIGQGIINGTGIADMRPMSIGDIKFKFERVKDAVDVDDVEPENFS